jgi:hypothetical protein
MAVGWLHLLLPGDLIFGIIFDFCLSLAVSYHNDTFHSLVTGIDHHSLGFQQVGE